jgi:diamine N-acetyltransferase
MHGTLFSSNKGPKMDYFLRELVREDLQEINKWRSDEGLIEKLGSVFRYIGMEVDQKWFDNYLQSRRDNIRLGICDLKTKVIIGAIYLLNIDWVNRHGEMSIWIGDTARHGNGVGKFALEELLRHAFLDLNLHRVWLRVLSDNEAAIHLYSKVGFAHEGRSREVVYKNGSYADLAHMSCLHDDYVKARSTAKSNLI